MASNARCLCFFFLLVLSFSLQTQARESRFFSKFIHHNLRRKALENPESVSLSPAQSPSLAPAPAPTPESDVVEHGYGLYSHEATKSTNVVGEVKHIEAKDLGGKTFRDFVMAYPNGNGNGWNGNANEKGDENEKKGMSDTRFLENGKYFYDVNNERNGNEKQGMNEYVEEENGFPENKGNGNGYETEKQRMGEKRYLVNGKYYYGYVTKSDIGNENEKQGMSEYVEDENTFPESKWNGNGYKNEKQGSAEKRYLVNGKYYNGYVTKSENGLENENENEKQGMSEYVEENDFPENKGNRNEYETEKGGMGGEQRYLVNGKYYSGYVTKSENGNANESEKQGMSEYVEEENKGNENEYETEKQGTGEKKYLVNGKYYSGYVTKSENGNANENENEKQGMSEYVEEENNGNENEYETEKQGMGEKKYLVNGKYYSGYVTKSENGNDQNEKQWMNEYVKDENSFPQNKWNGNEYETEKQGMGEKKYLVNGKYYSGYVTKSGNGNENEKQGMIEYVEDENSYPENNGNGNGYETEKQRGEKRYLVNGKYYSGYVTSENEDRNNQNYKSYEDLGIFDKKNEYANGYNENENRNENEFYEGNNEYDKEQEYVP